jgi:glycopeptide antibiotics resistance protein
VILVQVHCQECWISPLTLWIHLAHSSYELQQFFPFGFLLHFLLLTFPALASFFLFSFLLPLSTDERYS